MKCISLKSVTGGVFKMTLLALTVASLGTACNKSQSSPAGAPAEPTDEVVFSAGGPAMNSAVSTKATVVDALPSFYAGCTTGAAGSEVSVWNSTTFTGNGSPMVYKGDKWWPITDPSYHFYASNAALTFAAGGTTVAASNATDVICAYLPEPTYKVRNVLSFEHIFARLGQVTVSASASYAINDVSISITPKVSGTYNLRTGAGKTDGTGWSGTVNGSAAVIAARAAELARSGNFSQANDIYLVPGTYTISATWTATAPGYSETFSNKTQEISITAGKVNKITTTLGGRGTEIEFGVEIAAWDETTQDVDFLAEPSIAGLIFAPGDLYTTGSGFAIADSWESTILAHDHSDATAGSTVANRFYFMWSEIANLFSTQPTPFWTHTDKDSDDIDNTKTIDGYRMPTTSEWNSVLNGPRAGATVNNTSGVRWCYVVVNGVTGGLQENNKQSGIILFPDNVVISSEGITDHIFNQKNGSWYNSTMTLSQLRSLIAVGCVFLPAASAFSSSQDSWEYYEAGFYHSATRTSNNRTDHLYFNKDEVPGIGSNDEDTEYPARLVKSAN